MRKLLLGISVFVTTALIQADWRSIRADNNLTIKMPGEVSNSVYKNQKIISSYSDSANLHLSFEENTIELHFQDKNALLKGYDDYIIGYVRAFKNPKVQMTRELVLDGLVAKKVEFEADYHGARMNILAAFVIVNNRTYAFQIITKYDLNDVRAVKRFLSGVNFNNSLTRANQID